MDDEMMTGKGGQSESVAPEAMRTGGHLLGLALDRALEEIRALGVLNTRVERIAAPGKPEGRGTLRVVRVLDGGRRLTVARFPDEVEMES